MPSLFGIAALLLLWQSHDATLPARANMLLTAEGRGVQIYQCTAQPAGFQWTFRAPEAKLYDGNGKEVGTHGEGPSWTWNDGSKVVGKVVEKQPSPDSGSIPWLLLAATPSAGLPGALGSVAWVRRFDTHGGAAPVTGCDAEHAGLLQRVDYRATYAFYAGVAS